MIKEVANVYFQALADEGDIKAGDIVLYLDTLKVSTVETTAENVSAQGGWGNPKLVTWDYGKDINVTLEDAVVSWEELRIIMGGAMYNKTTDEHTVTIYKNAERNFKVGETFTFPMGDGKTSDGKNHFPGEDVVKAGFKFKWVDMTHGLRGSGEVDTVTNDGSDPAKFTVTLKTGTKPFADAATEITKIRFFWEEEVVEENVASEIVISPSTFPGTYKVVGDALIRSEATGKDEAFQFIINKAKMLSEVTLTMQAEGDPSTFSMTLNVLRDNDGNMMSLVKY